MSPDGRPQNPPRLLWPAAGRGLRRSYNGIAAAWTMLTVLLALAFAGDLHAGNVEITSIETTVSDLASARNFYADVLQFKPVSESSDAERRTATLKLGDETLVLVDPDAPSLPIPADMRANDRAFQHIAIVVSDMDAAYRHLLARKVVMVSRGPQTLPDWNFDAAGIRALYFRDPDGHFLELIQFPRNKGEPKWQRRDGRLFLGIDHTAIVVADTKPSLHFYRDVIGLTLGGSSLNYGVEQDRLNGIPNSHVKITGLHGIKGPGIELLQYLKPGHRVSVSDPPGPADLLHWRINLSASRMPVLESQEPWISGSTRSDPDGHALSFTLRADDAPRFEFMLAALNAHWPRYLMEGAQLGVFLMIALYLTIAIEHPASPIQRAIPSATHRRALIGTGIGLTIVTLIYSPWGRQSGAHFNTAITIAHWWLDHIEPWDALFYILAQFIGGWLGLVIAALPVRRLALHEKVKYVVTEPGKRGHRVAFIGEFVISFVLLFTLLQVVHQPALKAYFGVVAALLVWAYITFESPFSEMSMNPARSLASAIPARHSKGLWIYFVAPTLGMLLAAWLCRQWIDS